MTFRVGVFDSQPEGEWSRAFLLTRTLYTELSELQNEAVPPKGQGKDTAAHTHFCSPCGRETESKSLRTMATHDLRSNQGRDGWQGEQLHFPRVPHVGRNDDQTPGTCSQAFPPNKLRIFIKKTELCLKVKVSGKQSSLCVKKIALH